MITIRHVVCDREPYSVHDTASAMDAAEYMASRNIGAVCVLDEQGKLCGIFSERDLLNRVVVRKLDPASVRIRDVMNKTADLINRAEAVRAQIANVKTFVGDDAAAKELRAAGDDLDKKVIAVEERLFNMTATGRGQDALRMPSQLMEKLAHLADTLQLSDFAPTDQQLEVQKLLGDQVASAGGDLNTVVTKDLAAFNGMLQRRSIGAVIVR